MKNKEKGITLIALIITIIVMLILVGVTINVALNGGLFEKAKNASDQTQRESDREQLISAAMACIGTDGKVVLTGANGLDSNLPEEFKLVSSGIYENKKTGKQYKVDQTTGNVTEYTNSGIDDLIPNADELALGDLKMDGDTKQYAYGETDSAITVAYIDGGFGKIVVIEGDDIQIGWACNQDSASAIFEGAQPYTWYYLDTNEIYSSSCPFELIDFEGNILSESYINRIISSF